MDLWAYHHALNCGFSESEATRIGEDAFEDAMILQAQERAYYEELERQRYEAEAEAMEAQNDHT